MTPEIQRLFEAAIGLPADVRAEFASKSDIHRGADTHRFARRILIEENLLQWCAGG